VLHPVEPPSLDILIQREADAAEALSMALIRLTLARVALQNRIRDIREAQPDLFNQSP